MHLHHFPPVTVSSSQISCPHQIITAQLIHVAAPSDPSGWWCFFLLVSAPVTRCIYFPVNPATVNKMKEHIKMLFQKLHWKSGYVNRHKKFSWTDNLLLFNWSIWMTFMLIWFSFERWKSVRPLEVTIISPKRILSAGMRSELVCRSSGSRPPALITWFKGSSPVISAKDGGTIGSSPEPSVVGTQQSMVIRQSVSSDGNVSLSSLSLIPSPSDNGLVISCRASNPVMQSSGHQVSLEEKITLQVHCKQ